MNGTNYDRMYKKIFKIMGSLTPLRADCGKLCGGACCKGDENTGMRLFPHEETVLPVKTAEDGVRVAVCDGTCDRDSRPLSCRIFPFFPVVDENGKVFVEPDHRAGRICPLLMHSEDILFDKRFFKAVKRVGKLLAKDEECLAFLRQTTEDIDLYGAFLAKTEEE